ncbi:hypothetical protein K432DRAFT_430834 [Lepidopterella palustris CBS 459.81]|uniref:NAD(P)-binding domain-containing protein n=1 Tax=Lepidopterella palustris CBS 459.81 TaxID=1314670 RepID=A0A8E2DWK7_9PEZI|nr:hypothetical protein K432DRAFT_430834 [Lepidopterella palustris CBS 459.81]
MSNQKHLLLLGSTGGSGICTLEQALERGYKVTVCDRKTEKLPARLTQNENLTVHKSTLPNAPSVLDPLMEQFDAIISLLGPNNTKGSGDELEDFYKWLIPRLLKIPKAQRPYVLVVGTQTISDPKDAFSVITWIHVQIIGFVAKGAKHMILGIERQWRPYIHGDKAKGSGENQIDCAIFRLNMVKDGTQRDGAKAGYVGRDGHKPQLERSQLAKWLLDEIEERKWVGKMPAIWGENVGLATSVVGQFTQTRQAQL